VRRKPLLRVRKTGALLVAGAIAFVGTVPLAGASRALTWVLIIPAAVIVWAWRAGTDVYADELRVKALVGSTRVPWSGIAELAPDERGRVSALLDNGNAIRLTGVTRDNLARVLAVAGKNAPAEPVEEAD
jgi:PH (Pleckstrin Homology) domain-containing protein